MASQEVMKHNQTVLDSLEKGDLVEIPRGAYSHWAVYIGDQNVIHLTIVEDERRSTSGSSTSRSSTSGSSTSRSSTSGSSTSCCCECSSTGIIRMDNFFKVAGKAKAKRNNRKTALRPDEIVKNALSRLNEVGYNAVIKNCEHFATWCRYGEASSDQVQFWTSVGVIGAAAALVIGVLVAFVLMRCKK